jgi:hypothetical protein
MVFIWLCDDPKENYAREYRYGSKTRGLKHNGRRPDRLYIDKSEIAFHLQKHEEYISTMLLPALNISGRIIIYETV